MYWDYCYCKKVSRVTRDFNVVVLGFDLHKQTQKKAMMNKISEQRSSQIWQKLSYFQSFQALLTGNQLLKRCSKL